MCVPVVVASVRFKHKSGSCLNWGPRLRYTHVLTVHAKFPFGTLFVVVLALLTHTHVL